MKRFSSYEMELLGAPDLYNNPPVMGAAPSEVFNNRGGIPTIDNNGGDTPVPPTPVPEGFVDFGLSSGTLWYNKNIGATNGDTAESWYGKYYAWGETETKSDYGWANYKYANGVQSKLTKYCYDSEYGNEGYTDELTQLVAVDDVATVTNSAWTIPTKEQYEELISNTTPIIETNYQGIEGLNGVLLAKVTTTQQSFKNIPLYIAGEGEMTDEIWSEIKDLTLEEINAMMGGQDIRTMLFKDAEYTILAEYDVDYGFVEKTINQNISIFIPYPNFGIVSQWTKTLGDRHPYYAYYFYVMMTGPERVVCGVSDTDLATERFGGLSVRPVTTLPTA